MTIEDVAHNLEMSCNTIKNIEKVYLKRYFSKPDLSKVRHIAIDEFAAAKGHIYMTVVMDLDTTRVLYVGKGRDQNSLKKFWKRIRKKKVKIEAVAMDMWPAYISSVLDHCPDADIVFDRFHIVKMLNTKLDEIRRDLYRDETQYNKRDLLKGTRWLLLMNNANLKDNAKERLEEALKLNKPMAS
jgi:transposase